MDNLGLCILLLVILIFLSAFFSAAETSINSVNLLRLRQMVKDQKHKNAKIAYGLVEKPARVITAILIMNNLVNILASTIATIVFVNLFSYNGLFISTTLMTIFIIIFGEIIPKIIARLYPELFLSKIARFLKIIVYILYPLCVIIEKMENCFKPKTKITATEDELLDLVSTIENEGVLEQNEREMIESIIEFDDTTVKDIMINRENVVFIYDNEDFNVIKDIVKEHKFSRIPVISFKNLEILGILNTKDIFNFLLDQQSIDIKKMLKKPLIVSQRRKLPSMLHTFQRSREHMAIVVDNLKNNNFIGIVTLEDVLEEIVGEIYDEHDKLPEDIIEVGLHNFIVLGSTKVADFCQKFDIEIDIEDKNISFSDFIYHLVGDKKVRKNREIAFNNLDIKILETKDGIAKRLEIEVNSFSNEN